MDAEILGIKELTDKLKSLNINLTKKTGLKMVAAAGAVIRKEAKSIAQAKGLRKTGSLINNIAIKRERNTPPDTVQYNVGVRHGRDFGKRKNVVKYLAIARKGKRRGRIITRYKNDPYYWRFLEFGTKNISPTKFLEPALNNKRQEAINAMSKKLDDEMLKGRL